MTYSFSTTAKRDWADYTEQTGSAIHLSKSAIVNAHEIHLSKSAIETFRKTVPSCLKYDGYILTRKIIGDRNNKR